MALVEVGDLINSLNDPMALVGVVNEDLISLVEIPVGVEDLITYVIFLYICGFGNS